MKTWLELFRISNLPTIWTNVGAGAAIGCMLILRQEFTFTTVVAIVLTILAASCLYTGGMVLNDVFDFDIDKNERPARPLPSGRIPASIAGIVGWGLLLAGIALAAFAGMGSLALPCIALVIAVLTVLYNGLHTRTAFSIVFLAASRGLLYPLGAMSCAPLNAFDSAGTLLIVLVAGAAFVHTIALSLVARGEADQESHAPALTLGFGTIALAIPGGMAVVMMLTLLGTHKHAEVWPLPGISAACTLFFLLAWLARDLRNLMGTTPATTRFVLGSIAAFCLYDASIVALLPSPYFLFALIPLALFLVVNLAHRSIHGT
jgi:4-hydroxybenzoate polyprenyltransferase